MQFILYILFSYERLFEVIIVVYAKSNQIFYCTRCIATKRITSFRVDFHVIAPGQHSSFQRNVAAKASRWQQSVRFDRFEI